MDAFRFLDSQTALRITSVLNGLYMDPNQPATGELQQNTPVVDPAEHAHLQEVIVPQGSIIRLYQDQLDVLRAAVTLSQSTALALPESASKFLHPGGSEWLE